MQTFDLTKYKMKIANRIPRSRLSVMSQCFENNFVGTYGNYQNGNVYSLLCKPNNNANGLLHPKHAVKENKTE